MSHRSLLYIACLAIAAWCMVATIVFFVRGQVAAGVHAAQLAAIALLCADRVTLHTRCDQLETIASAATDVRDHALTALNDIRAAEQRKARD